MQLSLIISALLVISPSLRGDDFRDMVAFFEDYPVESAQKINLENMILELPSGTVEFQSGRLYLLAFHDSVATAAYFEGNGRCRLFPPDEVEAQQIRRHFGSDTLAFRFEEAYFVFGSARSIMGLSSGTMETAKTPYRVRQGIRRLRQIPSAEFDYDLPLYLAKAISEGRGAYMWADFVRRDYEHAVYMYDPYHEEPVSLFRLAPDFRTPQWVSSFTGPIGGSSGFNVLRYEMEVDLSTYGKSNITCDMTIKISGDSIRVLPFSFPRDYNIAYISGAVPDSTAFFKRKDQPGAVVMLDRAYKAGDTVRVGLHYRTNLFYHYEIYGVIQKHLTHWYPYAGFRSLADYDVQYTIDKGYDFLAVGERTGDSAAGDKNIYEYRTSSPVAYVSFNYGLFDSSSAEDVPVTIYTLSRLHQSSLFGNPNLRKVQEDITGAFRFYSGIFAPFRFGHLKVAAISIMQGQGSPGMVHLPSQTFLQSRPGYDDRLRAHEVAHQWWGHAVNPAGYRDVWLSEGLAEYSATMYIETVKKDQVAFLTIIEEWHKEIIQKGKAWGQKSVGYRAGAIILGTRLKGELSPGDYMALVYSKAAYMLHMLRFEMDDVRGNKGDFMIMLGEFARKYEGKLARSGDFIEMVRPYLGARTDSFFGQWLYDWRVPKIKKDYDIKPDGTAEMDITVKEVGEDFVTPYPVTVKYEDGISEVIIFHINKGRNNFELKSSTGRRIKEVKFNPEKVILEQ